MEFRGRKATEVAHERVPSIYYSCTHALLISHYLGGSMQLKPASEYHTFAFVYIELKCTVPD